jgi:L-rhamnose mutarotase
MLRLQVDKIKRYEEDHRHVWPELIEQMESFGVTEYSIFRRGQLLFLYMHVLGKRGSLAVLAIS